MQLLTLLSNSTHHAPYAVQLCLHTSACLPAAAAPCHRACSVRTGAAAPQSARAARQALSSATAHDAPRCKGRAVRIHQGGQGVEHHQASGKCCVRTKQPKHRPSWLAPPHMTIFFACSGCLQTFGPRSLDLLQSDGRQRRLMPPTMCKTQHLPGLATAELPTEQTPSDGPSTRSWAPFVLNKARLSVG